MSSQPDTLARLRERAQRWRDEFDARVPVTPLEEDLYEATEALLALLDIAEANAKLTGYVAALIDDPESVVAQQLVMEAWRESNAALAALDPDEADA